MFPQQHDGWHFYFNIFKFYLQLYIKTNLRLLDISANAAKNVVVEQSAVTEGSVLFFFSGLVRIIRKKKNIEEENRKKKKNIEIFPLNWCGKPSE